MKSIPSGPELLTIAGFRGCHKFAIREPSSYYNFNFINQIQAGKLTLTASICQQQSLSQPAYCSLQCKSPAFPTRKRKCSAYCP